MKLPAVIFLVWVAQLQGAASASTASTTVGVSITTTGGETTTPPTATTTPGPGAPTTSSIIDTTSPIPTTTEVVTVPTTPVPNCAPTGTPAKLRIAGASPCIATKLNDQTVQFESPRFPRDYPNSVECKANTTSDGPRYLEVTPKIFSVHKSDKLIIRGPFGYEKRVQSADLNNSISLPSAYAKFEFTSSDSQNMKGFKVNIRSRTNSCQKICSLQAGSTGYIRNGAYAADTYCEWWMEAPTGCFIRMKFEKFDVGPASSTGGPWSCDKDYVGVDRDGDPGYDLPNSKTFCGSELPNTIRSVDNKINVLFNGRKGGYNGFRIKYTVVC